MNFVLDLADVDIGMLVCSAYIVVWFRVYSEVG